jgi:hypothetical protein
VAERDDSPQSETALDELPLTATSQLECEAGAGQSVRENLPSLRKIAQDYAGAQRARHARQLNGRRWRFALSAGLAVTTISFLLTQITSSLTIPERALVLGCLSVALSCAAWTFSRVWISQHKPSGQEDWDVRR